MKTKLRASVFRKAARLVAPSEALEYKDGYHDEFACNCIDEACGHRGSSRSTEACFFEALFDIEYGNTFGGMMECSSYPKTEEIYPLRLIALELAALCIEDGLTLEDLE